MFYKELKHEDWLNVQAYKQSLKDEQRKSIAMRLVHARKQKEEALVSHKGFFTLLLFIYIKYILY